MKLADRSTLVLNKTWQAVGVISTQDAVKKVINSGIDGEPKARIVDCASGSFATMTWADWEKQKPADGEDYIKTCGGLVVRIPEVIVVSHYDKMPMKTVRFSRQTIYKRDGYTCQYCGCQPGTSELSIDHVMPISRGGKSTWENTVLACIECNSRKADKTPQEAKMKLRKQPQKPTYSLFSGKQYRRVKSWSAFVDAAYWNVELENDNED